MSQSHIIKKSTMTTHESCIPLAPSTACQQLVHAESLLSTAVVAISSGRGFFNLKVKHMVSLESPPTSESQEAAPFLQEEVATPHHCYSAISKYLICVATVPACSHPVKQVMAEGMCEVTGDTVTVSDSTGK